MAEKNVGGSLKEIYEALKVDFPQEAFTTDRSRGFQLIGIRGAFVVERLNETFGLLGDGWRFAHSAFEERTYSGKQKEGVEFVTEVVLQYRTNNDGCFPVNWTNEGWLFDYARDRVWSEPVYGVGGNNVGPGSTPISDAKKGAVSNALGKAASRLGVGILAYKGQLEIDGAEVVVKGENSIVSQLAESTEVNAHILSALSTAAPDKYQSLRSYHIVEEHFVEKVLKPLNEYIAAHDLTKFVADNYRRILHNKELGAFQDMTMRETAFLAEVLMAIVTNDDLGWKDALSVTDTWDGQEAWGYIYQEWLASKATVNDE